MRNSHADAKLQEGGCCLLLVLLSGLALGIGLALGMALVAWII